MTKKALVTGITGQDGSYLAELLLNKGYEVTGLVRRSSVSNLARISHLLPVERLTLVEGEISDSFSVYSIIENGNFDEVYNLAAQSHVGTSFKQPAYTFDVNIKGPMNLLEAIRERSPLTKFYQASTSELFGSNCDVVRNFFNEVEFQDLLRRGLPTTTKVQHERTAFKPQSPYACAKLAAHDMVRIYREGYGVHASAGILFNHESERRGEQFVTRKITKWIAEFYHWLVKAEGEFDPSVLDLRGNVKGYEEKIIWDSGEAFPMLRLGNLDAKRDWGHAEDYVEAMYLMLQQEKPDDYVISTGKTYSVREFLSEAFNEIGIENFEPYVVIDPKFYRPAEVEYLCGDSTKARRILGWKPEIEFKDLVKRMVWSDINAKEEESPKASRATQS